MLAGSSLFRRAVDNPFPEVFPKERFGDFAGLIQSISMNIRVFPRYPFPSQCHKKEGLDILSYGLHGKIGCCQ